MSVASKYARSGVRRLGDDYQDAVALDVLVSMLEAPDRYDWVQVEADGFGYLDDVVALRQDGTVEATQVKFSAHPEEVDDPYDWDDLTQTRKAKDGSDLPSLIGKWGPTVLDLLARHAKVEAALVTNRRAEPGLDRCIDKATDRVRPERVPPEVMGEVTRQLGGSAEAVRFLTSFDFRLSQPGLNTLTEGIRRRFDRLGGSNEGWLNLKESLRRWACEKTLPGPDGRIRLAHVRHAALWNRLEALPQGFEVPSDYVLPSGTLHAGILARLAQQAGVCLVISGTPGIGKSTYLSYLHEQLRQEGRPVVRHHYFVSLSDRTVGRFDHRRILQSLMADLQPVAHEAVAAFEARNPTAEDFPKWLDACSNYYSGQQSPLAIIVDGLDHVWRERGNAAELAALFEYLLPCRPGIALVVGTQPVANEQLPKRLLDAAPRNGWLDMPPLDRQAVLAWTRRNEARLEFRRQARPEDREDELREIAGAFSEVSEGQPLLLRYALNGLIEADRPVNAHTIRERCPRVGGNVVDYYRSLWNGLGGDGQRILCMVASAGFEWPTGGVTACCVRCGIGVLDAERSWEQVRHMMCRVPLGWRPFHGSLNVFVGGTQEYKMLLQQVRPAVASWLDEEAPDYWRWAYAWKVRADMGDHAPLLAGTTREWTVESLARGYPHAQVSALLARASRQALVSGDLRTFAHRALLFEYVNDTYNLTNWDSESEWTSAQLALCLVDRLPEVLSSRRTELDDEQLAALAESLHRQGDSRGVAETLDELVDRFNTRGTREGSRDWISRVEPVIWTEALSDRCSADRIADRIRRNREHTDSVRFSRTHAEALKTRGRAGVLRTLCDTDLADEERGGFLKHGFLLALVEDADWSDVARRHSQDPFSAIYARAKNLSEFVAPNVPLPAIDLLSLPAHQIHGNESTIAGCLERCFDRMLALYLWDHDGRVGAWLSDVGDYTWARAFVQRLGLAAKNLASAISTGRRWNLSAFYSVFSELPRPQFNTRDGGYEFWQVARQALTELAFDSVALTAGNARGQLDVEAVRSALASSHVYRADWIRRYVRRRRAWLTAEALDWVIAKYGDDSGASIEDRAREGAAEATVLASLAALHGRRDQALGFLRRAADLSLTYGYHKDILLHDFVDVIESLAGRSPEVARRELAPVIPAILRVHDFTDGDETRHVPGRLFDLLATLWPEWLPPIYQHLCRQEAYRDAQDAFARLLRSLPFASPVEVALAATCLDAQGVNEVEAKATGGCCGAQQALESARGLLGTNPFPAKAEPDRGDTSGPLPTERSSRPNLAEYPPDRLEAYWKAIRESTYGRGSEELKAWAEDWQQRVPTTSVRDALARLHESDDYAECAGLIHDLTVRLDGRAAAWPWLVKAHREVHGWSAHWTGKGLAREKWEIVARHYPDRWLDFVVESLEADRWRSDDIGIHGRFPRLVTYLLLVGRETKAQSLIQGVREAVEGLVAPFGTVPADWLEDGKASEDRLLDVLLSRLTWPSGMVRERACTALAGLLGDPDHCQRVAVALVDWIRKQDLESEVCLGLLPFVKARQLAPRACIPDCTALRDACQRPSLLYEILLEELVPGQGRAMPPGKGHTGTAPREFEPATEFREQHDHALPLIYRSRAESIDGRFGVPFLSQWAYEVEHTGDGLRSALVSIDFWGWSDGEHYVAFECPLSEGLRSGYLRALAWLAEQGDAQRFWAHAEALQTLPIDLGLWRVQPQPRPAWWPLRQSPGKSDVDTTPVSVLDAIEGVCRKQGETEWVLGLAGGRVAEGGAVYDLDVFGIFQRCVGPDAPNPEDVWEAKPWRRETLLLDPVRPRLSGAPHPVRADRVAVSLGDWGLLPSVLAAHPHMTARWQWWRLMRGLWLPLPALARDGVYRVDCEPGRVAFHSQEGELGFWQDWTAGLSEMLDANLTPRTGQVLMLRRSAVERLAAETKSTFCWACRVTGFAREHQSGQFDEFSIPRVIGASRLILNA